MDPALKQRLIGAAVLVALAVIFVPMLLDAPEPTTTPASAIPLDIPAEPGAPLQTRDIPLALPKPATPTSSSSAPVDPDRVVTVDANAAPRVDALSGSEHAPAASSATEAAPPAEAAPPPAVAQAPATVAAPSPTAVNPPKPSAVSEAAKPAPVSPSPAPAASATGRFVVNLGSYGNSENASALEQRLRKQGVQVMVETIQLDGKPAKRLRAGPYRSRAEAEKAQLQLARSEPGNAFSVGELDAAEPAPAAATARGAFAVQVGALKDESEANQLRDRLRGAGFAAYVAKANTDAGVLWRVRAGPELDRARADALRNQVKQRLQLDGLVVAHP